MEMSFNILEMSSYFHYFYSQFLFKQYEKSSNCHTNWAFFFLWKFERPVVLWRRLTRKFRLRSFITFIYGYPFQFWIKTSTRSKKRILINAPNKRRGCLLNFWFFPYPLELIGTLSRSLYFEFVKYGTTFLLLEHSIHSTEARKNLLCLNLSSFLS